MSLEGLSLNRYPDPKQLEVKALLTEMRGVRPEQIFVGVGSDEAIDLLIRVFCSPGKDTIIVTPPTYGMYKVTLQQLVFRLYPAAVGVSGVHDVCTRYGVQSRMTSCVHAGAPGNAGASNEISAATCHSCWFVSLLYDVHMSRCSYNTIVGRLFACRPLTGREANRVGQTEIPRPFTLSAPRFARR